MRLLCTVTTVLMETYISVLWERLPICILKVNLVTVEGSGREWYISSMLHSPDIFWSGTLEILCKWDIRGNFRVFVCLFCLFVWFFFSRFKILGHQCSNPKSLIMKVGWQKLICSWVVFSSDCVSCFIMEPSGSVTFACCLREVRWWS